MERFWQKEMNLDKLTQPGLGDSADHFHERDKRYSTTEMKVPAVINLQLDEVAAMTAPTTFGEVMESVDIFPGKS